ncbi:glycoside hydrolase family 16 protein [Sunxiuqinia sp. A32]|uniref:glycoside hydrolase family 16 protein n=1 Tax=Sunxiuqinia sp. A32 TaxID=3461496 RepID=UPI00404646A9
MKPKQIIKLFLLIVVATGYSCGSVKKEKKEVVSNSPYELVWCDEFDYVGLPDTAKWSYDTRGNSHGWGNNELQFYTNQRSKNVRVDDDKLVITALREDYEGRNYTSTRLSSRGKGDWQYGRIEVKAKLPFGKGTWPAIWMMPTESKYKGWPACGEIDIMEHVGYDPGVVHGTIHTLSYNHSINTQKANTIEVPNLFADFHEYAIEWDQEQIQWFVDNEPFFTFKNEHNSYKEWPFDQKFHLLLNLAVGGNWGGKFGVDDSIFPQSMVVEYVRVYKKREQ